MWISVDERLPEEYQRVLVSRNYNTAPVCSATFRDGEFSTGASVMDTYAEPTHWMPLPPPPE